MRSSGFGIGSRAALVAVGTLAAAAGCDRGEPGTVPPPGEPVEVRATSPVEGASTSTYTGQVLSASDVQLATRTSGRIEAVLVDVGDPVRAGAPLVRLDASGVESRIAAAEAAAERARKSFERIRNLERDGAATAQELDDARAALATAEAALREARSQRDYVVLRAPFAGTVSARSVDPGDLALPGVPVLGLLRPDSLKVIVALPAEAARAIAPGDSATLRDPGGTGAWPARVSSVSPSRDSGSRRVQVELVPVEGGGAAFSLLPGSFVRVERRTGVPTVWLPSDALVRRGQLTGVFVVEDGALALRWVRTGLIRDGTVEVLAGLTPSDTVVRSPAAGLADGARVRAVRSSPWSPGTEASP